jgi:RNA recognition motif-containing protein
MATKLFVAGLAYAATDEDLREHFATVGSVESAKVVTDRETGRSRGFGFVEMGTEEDAKAAIEKLNGTEILGRAISVNEAKPQEKREGGSFRRDDRRSY